MNLALCSLVIEKGDAKRYLGKGKGVLWLPPEKYQEGGNKHSWPQTGMKNPKEMQDRKSVV